MATKSKKIYRKKEDRSLELVGYLPTEDVSSRVDSALAKKQDKLTPGKGISINTTTNEISVNDGAFATTDYVMNNFVANSIYEQDKDGLDHDIYGLASRVTANESSINNLNNAVADRYTKAETDGKLDNEAVKTNNTKDITYNEIAAMKRSYVGSSKLGPYRTDDGSHENLIRIVNNYFGGTNYVFEMSHEFWGNNGIHYRYKAEGEYSQWKTLIDSDIIGSQHVAEADHASVADTFTYGRGVLLSANSVNENTSWVKAVFGDENNDNFHITVVRALDTGPKYIPANHSAGIAWKGFDTYGALTVSYNYANAYICGGNGTSPVWGRHLVLSENGSNIADQSVAYADRAGYANSSGTAAVCESTTLLAAEGTNLGAKIRSQYTTGTPGGSVTYHQATWYVTGNDGDTYNFSKMITTDNFGTNLTEALKNTKVEHSTRSDYATHLDYRNDDSTSISISYDNDNGTSLKYTSYPKLTINGITGYGVLEGNVYNHGSFQLAVSDNSNGTIYIRNVAKDGSAPSWAKLLIDDDAINSLDSDIINRPLSAYQGKVLNGKITSLSGKIDSLQNLPSWVTDDGFQNSANMYLTNFFAGTFSKKTSYSAGEDYMLDISITAASFGRGKWYATASPCGVNGSTGDWSTQFTVTCSILNESTIRVWFHCLNGSNSSSSTKLYCNVVAIKYW